jgi:Ca-activated chloride channel family protein
MDDQLGGIDIWYSFKWFSPSLLANYTWENSFFLYLIPVIILLLMARWLMDYFISPKLVISLSEGKIKFDITSLLRFIPFLFLLLAVTCILFALARPQKSNEKVEQWTEGIDIMLAVDISESMKLMDFEPNRLEAAKDVALNFINGRFQDRIGLVIFSGEAYSLAPLTTDYELLKTYILDIDFNKIESRGTAIGSALAVATNRMRESESKSKVIILISDGDNTAGNIDPVTAAKLAHAYDIKVYTIAIGKEGKVPMGRGPFGQIRYIDNNLDESTLREIASIGDGSFFRATNNKALEHIFNTIDTYEKAEIKETNYKDTTDFYVIYLNWGIVFLLFWLLSKSTFMSNVLQD